MSRNHPRTWQPLNEASGSRVQCIVVTRGTGLVIARDHVMPASPLTEATTATAGNFHSDWSVLVLVLYSSAASDANQKRLFRCSCGGDLESV